MSIPISRQPGDGSPVVVQNAKIVHHPSALVHTGAKNFDSTGFIELAIHVNGYAAGQPLKVGSVHVSDALVSTKPVNRFPSDRPQKISFEELNGLVVNNYGGLLVAEFRDLPRGSQYLEEALQILEHVPATDKTDQVLSDTLDNLAGTYRLRHEPVRAMEMYRRTLAIDRKRHNDSGLVMTTTNIAELLFDDMGDVARAEEQYRKALAVILRRRNLNPDEVWDVDEGIGRLYLRQGRFQLAEGFLRKAVSIVESLRGTLDNAQEKRLFRGARSRPYYSLALLYAREGNAEKLVDAIESGKAAALLESGTAVTARPLPALTSAEIQTRLELGDIVLEYCVGADDDPVLLLALQQNAVRWFYLPSPRTLRDSVQQVLGKGPDSPDAERSRRELSSKLFPPVLLDQIRRTGPKRALICPDGLLQNVPFETLILNTQNGKPQYLIESMQVSLTPSIRWWCAQRRRSREPAPHDVLVVADPRISGASAAFDQLPATRREADIVLSYGSRGSVRLVGNESSTQAFEAARPTEFKVIHFATHARTGGSLDSSFLLFGSSPGPDLLRGSQVLGLHLSGQLVVLSACDTAAGRSLSGEGVDSLAYGFLMAGAACVIASRGRLPDDVPGPFMNALYEHLSQGASIDEAMRQAKLRFLDSRAANRIEVASAFEAVGFGDTVVAITPAGTTRALAALKSHWIGITAGLAALLIVTLLVLKRRSIFRQPHARSGSGS